MVCEKKHWIGNTVETEIVYTAKKILDANKEEVEQMVANNAFLLREMKEEAKKEGIKEKSIEIAKNLLDILDDETIATKTGLTVEDVKVLREK